MSAMKVQRLAAPVEGHKLHVVKTCFETHCQCGWVSLPHWERKSAYSEWREHVAGHGGKLEWVDEASR